GVGLTLGDDARGVAARDDVGAYERYLAAAVDVVSSLVVDDAAAVDRVDGRDEVLGLGGRQLPGGSDARYERVTGRVGDFIDRRIGGVDRVDEGACGD
ncbi:MAG: hypothetical protein K2K86_05850, partial [Muribaculaceae bacterium]|nr:hypothetical protein [Muribaculaceae bacterium]